LDLPIEHRGILQLAVDGRLQQFVIGDRVPQEERQVGRELEVADGVRAPWFEAGWNMLGAIEEERARKRPGERAANARIEPTVLDALLVILEQFIHVLCRHRTPICAPRERRDDLLRTLRLRVTLRPRGLKPPLYGSVL